MSESILGRLVHRAMQLSREWGVNPIAVDMSCKKQAEFIDVMRRINAMIERAEAAERLADATANLWWVASGPDGDKPISQYREDYRRACCVVQKLEESQ